MIPNEVSNEEDEEQEVFSSDSYMLILKGGKLWLTYYYDQDTKYNYKERLSDFVTNMTNLGYNSNQPFILDAVVNHESVFDDGDGDFICDDLENCVSVILFFHDDESDANDFILRSNLEKLDL